MSLFRVLALMGACVLSVVACQPESEVDGEEEASLGEVTSPIKNGIVDTTTYGSVLPINIPVAAGYTLCSGIVVAPRRILTAAHCLDDRTGMPVLSINSVVYTAVTATAHPSYGTATRLVSHPDMTESSGAMRVHVGVDIAVLTFATDLPVPAMQLASTFPAYPGNLVAVGFGENATGAGTGTRRYADVRLKFPFPSVSTSNVQLYMGAHFYLAPTVAGGPLPCTGDSGGPLVDASNRVVAVISGGWVPGSTYTCGAVAAAHAVHVAGFQHWIMGTTSPHQNTLLRYDVNNDGAVAPIDSLVIINYINAGGPNPPPGSGGPYYRDVNADTWVSALDVNQVNNAINWSNSGRLFTVTTP